MHFENIYLIMMGCCSEDDRPIARNVVRSSRPDFSEENRDNDLPAEENNIVNEVRGDRILCKPVAEFREEDHDASKGQ